MLLRFNATQTRADNQYIYRIDQVFNSKDTLWGTWFNEKDDLSSRCRLRVAPFLDLERLTENASNS